MHDILLLRISAILPEAISDGGLTPTTDTDLLLATCRGGSHFTSDIITDQIYTALVAKNICTQAEIIILRILPFFPYLDEHYCLRAAGRLLSLPKGCILLTTGFYVAGHAETDGPPETVALAYTLQKAGFTPLKRLICIRILPEVYQPLIIPTIFNPYHLTGYSAASPDHLWQDRGSGDSAVAIFVAIGILYWSQHREIDRISAVFGLVSNGL